SPTPATVRMAIPRVTLRSARAVRFIKTPISVSFGLIGGRGSGLARFVQTLPRIRFFRVADGLFVEAGVTHAGWPVAELEARTALGLFLGAAVQRPREEQHAQQ